MPLIIKKHQTRLQNLDPQVPWLFAQGVRSAELLKNFKKVYGAESSALLVSEVTRAVEARVLFWQQRALESRYPLVYFFKLTFEKNHTFLGKEHDLCVALGVNAQGKKSLLGVWMLSAECSWDHFVGQLKHRGVKEMCVASIEGLKGLDEAILALYPQTHLVALEEKLRALAEG